MLQLPQNVTVSRFLTLDTDNCTEYLFTCLLPDGQRPRHLMLTSNNFVLPPADSHPHHGVIMHQESGIQESSPIPKARPCILFVRGSEARSLDSKGRYFTAVN